VWKSPGRLSPRHRTPLAEQYDDTSYRQAVLRTDRVGAALLCCGLDHGPPISTPDAAIDARAAHRRVGCACRGGGARRSAAAAGFARRQPHYGHAAEHAADSVVMSHCAVELLHMVGAEVSRRAADAQRCNGRGAPAPVARAPRISAGVALVAQELVRHDAAVVCCDFRYSPVEAQLFAGTHDNGERDGAGTGAAVSGFSGQCDPRDSAVVAHAVVVLVLCLLAGLDALTYMAERESLLLKYLIAPLEWLPRWSGVYLVFALFVLVSVIVAWWPVRILGRALGRAYSRKWLSDLLVVFTGVWAFALTDRALTLSTIAGAQAFAMYLPLLWIPAVMLLMDLRGFQAHNPGCRYELATLAQAPRELRVVALTDDRTDSAAAQAAIASGQQERFIWIEASHFNASNRREVLARLFA
jgi:hypothetical protein